MRVEEAVCMWRSLYDFKPSGIDAWCFVCVPEGMAGIRKSIKGVGGGVCMWGIPSSHPSSG